MKKLIAVVVSIGLLIAGGLVWADSYTTNYNLTKPSRGSANWDTKINTNMDIIDSALLSILKYINDIIIRPLPPSTGGFGTDLWMDSFSPNGDGVTDDSVALRVAIAACPATGCTLKLTETYRLADDITIPDAMKLDFTGTGQFKVDSGKTLTIPSPSYITASPKQQIFDEDSTVSFTEPGTIYPDWWKDSANGMAGMGTAINSAIESAASGSTIQFNSGTYLLTAEEIRKCEDLTACGEKNYLKNYFVNLEDNMTIAGMGMHSTTIKVDDHIYDQPNDDTSNAHVFQGFDIENVTIRDLMFDMNGYNNLTPSGKTRNSMAVRLDDGGSNVLIENLYILNNPGHNNVVANNTSLASKATGLTVRNCVMYGGGTGVLGNTNNVDFSFVYSEWTYTSANNNRLEQPAPTYTWSGGIELHASDSLASNNVIVYCDPAIWIASAQQTGAVDIARLGVAGNVIKDCATGVRFWSSGEIRDVNISNNVMSIMWRGGADKLIYGVQMVGRSSGNWLDSNAAGAPLFDVNIVNNVITGEDNDTRYGEGFGVPAGIAATSVHGLTVKGNTFHNLMGDGVLISGSPYGLSDLVIQGNYFKNWGRGHSGYGTAGVHVEISGGPAASWDETETVPDAGAFKLRTMVVENNVFEKEANSTNWLDQVVTAYPYVIAGDDQYTAGQVYDVIIRNNVDHLANDTTSSDRVGGNLGLMQGHPWGVFYHNPTDFTAITAPDSSDPLYNAGYSPRGRVAWNRHPGVVAVGQPIGWVCTVAGDPGTWVPFGHIHPDPFAHGGTYAERPTTATMVAGIMSSFVCTDCDDCGAGPTPIWYAWWEDKWRCFNGVEVTEP